MPAWHSRATALAAFAIVLAITGRHITSLYATSGITGCHGGSCAGSASQFLIDLTSGRGVPLLPDGANAYVIRTSLASWLPPRPSSLASSGAPR